MKTYLLTDEVQVIARAGEQDGVTLAVDVSAWLEEYSDGVGAMLCTRPDGKPVPVSCTLDETLLKAALPDECLSRPGVYQYTANWVQAGVIMKSQIYKCIVLSTENGRGLPPDCPGTPAWATEIFVKAEQVDAAADAALQMEQFAVDAEAARDQAVSAKEDAIDAKDDAEEALEQITAILDAGEQTIEDMQQAVTDAQAAADGIEAQKDTMIASIASVAGQGTDITFTQSGVAADAKAVGDFKNAFDNETLKSGWRVYYPAIENGSANSSGNTTAVHTDYIPVKYGQVVVCAVPYVKAASNYRSFGYIIYNSNKENIKYEDYGKTDTKKNSHIVIELQNAAYIRITIAEYTSGGSAVTLRKTDFATNSVKIYVRDEQTLETAVDAELMDGKRYVHHFKLGNWAGENSTTPVLMDSYRNRIIPFDFINVKQGDTIHVAGGNYDHAVCFWEGKSGTARKWYVSPAWVTTDADYHINFDGFAIVNFANKSDRSTDISLSSFNGSISITPASQRELGIINGKTKKFRIYHTLWFNGTWSVSGTAHMVADSKRVGTASFVKVYAGDTVHIGKGSHYAYSLALVAGTIDDYTVVRQDVFWTYTDSDFTIEKDGYIGIGFGDATDPTTALSVLDFDGEFYIDRELKVFDNNPQALINAVSGKKHYAYPTTQAAARLNSPRNDLATFVHVSDVHGDSETFANAYEFADSLGATAFLASGDLVYYYSTDDFSYAVKNVNSHNTPFIVCVGNHDAFSINAASQATKFITPFASNQGYTVPTGISNPTYFYKDFSDKKIRVISVNQFEYDGVESSNDTRRYMTQDQIDWFCQTLLSTPANYGVVVVQHSPEKLNAANDEYTKFTQKVLGTFDFGITILSDIIDAFISGTSINETYSNRSGVSPSTVTASANFSTKNTGVEFIAFINGHRHADMIGYVANTTNKQLQLNITCTNSWYDMNKNGTKNETGENNNPWLVEASDLNRADGSPSKDAFNVYCIDRDAKMVRVIRVGANMPNNLSEMRDYMAIPYAD